MRRVPRTHEKLRRRAQDAVLQATPLPRLRATDEKTPGAPLLFLQLDERGHVRAEPEEHEVHVSGALWEGRVRARLPTGIPAGRRAFSGPTQEASSRERAQKLHGAARQFFDEDVHEAPPRRFDGQTRRRDPLHVLRRRARLAAAPLSVERPPRRVCARRIDNREELWTSFRRPCFVDLFSQTFFHRPRIIDLES